VNAPVAPEAIYIGIGGSAPGLAVLDLNGFGQGTGRLAVSNFPKNPNVGRGGLFPGLAPGTSNLDAGGEGPLTLTKDSTGTNFRLLGAPLLSQVTDIHIGHPLDRVYNNENINANATRANQTNPNVGVSQPGNTITTAPHPNPPRLVMPPPNPAAAIFSEEPTATSSGGPVGTVQVGSPPCLGSPLNALVIGDPFAQNQNEIGLFHTNYAGVFYGPQPPPPSPQPPTPFCPYTSRQQIGHFLYVLDRGNRQVLVVNSNRFIVLETIKLSDPTSASVSPNLKLLAVTNFSSNSVSFIDIDPASPRFHTVTTETRVGNGPTGCAWQPEGEDLLVVNQTESSLSIIAGTDLRVRKTVTNLINAPIDVAVTSRQAGFGFATGIYFAYILNGNGTVAIFESGPDGVNGIGFDNVVGVPGSGNFRRARAMRADSQSAPSAIWIAHEDDTGLGQISHLELTSSLAGPIPIQPVSGGFILPPTFRQREWTVTGRLGGGSPSTPIKDKLSGNAPVDIAFDDLQNFGGLADLKSNQISNLTYAQHSGKGHWRPVPGAVVPGVVPRFVFVALGDTGKLDVFELDTGNRVKTLDIPGIGTHA
jgi:DNA-binding beta-propeller fold protein YncE